MLAAVVAGRSRRVCLTAGVRAAASCVSSSTSSSTTVVSANFATCTQDGASSPSSTSSASPVLPVVPCPKQSAATLRLYRLLVRDCQRVEEGNRTSTDTVGNCLLVQRDLLPREWGSSRLVSSPHLAYTSASMTEGGSVSTSVSTSATTTSTTTNTIPLGFVSDWREVLRAFQQFQASKNNNFQRTQAVTQTHMITNMPLLTEEDDDEEEYDDNFLEEEDVDDIEYEDTHNDDGSVSVTTQVDEDDMEEEDEDDSAYEMEAVDMDAPPTMESFLVTSDALKQCLREVFRFANDHPSIVRHEAEQSNQQSLPSALSSQSSSSLQQINVVAMRHSMAIDAFQFLRELLSMRANTSIYYHPTLHLRVIATSKFLSQPAEHKYRFTYRIRIENCADPGDLDQNHFQLLGRHWDITEQDAMGADLEDRDNVPSIDAPTTGAVGHLPVIAPGHVFEYVSGCDLASPMGRMEGFFYMAIVDEDAKSTIVGELPYHRNPTEKIKSQIIQEENRFKLAVASFPLQR